MDHYEECYLNTDNINSAAAENVGVATVPEKNTVCSGVVSSGPELGTESIDAGIWKDMDTVKK